jgi:signal transduction histidine kinase
MNAVAARLVVRLMAIQFIAWLAAQLLIVAFASRLLLLDPRVIDGSFTAALWCGGTMGALMVVSTLLLTRKLRPLLSALAAGSSVTEPLDLLSLYALPARIAIADVLAALVVCGATLAPPLRPASNDLATQGSLVLMALTFVSAASLPMYVMMRASVARVLELAPIAASREALALTDLRSRRYAPVRQRFVAAVGAPVTFVALGAALLVHAHVRTFDAAAREDDAARVASAALDVVGESGGAGRTEAISAATANGIRFVVDRGSAPFQVVHADVGETEVTVPLDDGHAEARFSTTRLDPVTGLYVLIALAATLLAGLLGSRIGQSFVHDVALATRAVREMGAADVIRGTRMRREARFGSVVALMEAIDALGNVFREFASAQEAAIEARAGTERMRGRFLASMSHDLKGPLNAILGFAELVSRSPLTPGQQESLAIIAQRGRELLTLIQTILDSASVEARELRVAPEWTMMGDVVMSAILDARELAALADVEVVGEIQPGVPKLYVDASRIVQALTAVIGTAVRFTEKGVVRVRVTTSTGSDALRIDVEASGRTAPSAERDKIFEAFKDADRARRHGGLGLGLSLARSIFEIHGGIIQVDMTHAGGWVFHVRLPASAEQVAMAVANASRAAPADVRALASGPERGF